MAPSCKNPFKQDKQKIINTPAPNSMNAFTSLAQEFEAQVPFQCLSLHHPHHTMNQPLRPVPICKSLIDFLLFFTFLQPLSKRKAIAIIIF